MIQINGNIFGGYTLAKSSTVKNNTNDINIGIENNSILHFELFNLYERNSAMQSEINITKNGIFGKNSSNITDKNANP